MDLDALLSPRDDTPPSGENLEYSLLMELELAAQYGEQQQMGDEVIEGKEPDFAEVTKLATGVLEQSHDIRAAVYLAEAVLHTKGLPEFAQVTSYVRGLLEQYWETCHPELDEDDGDATMRINAVRGLAGSDRVLRALRRTPLTESRVFGRMTLRHIEVAEGTINPPSDMDSPPDSGAISAAFQDSDGEVLEARAAAVAQAIEDVKAIDAVFSEQTPGEGPELDVLRKALVQIQKTMSHHVAGAAAPDADGDTEAGTETGDAPAGGGGAAPAAAPGPSGGGAINSSEDVIRMLDRMMAYYARSEPSSPVPILLERAKRLVNADFLTIIEDMAKDGLEEVRRIGGIKAAEEEYY